MSERVLCAAVHYRNGKKYEHQPKNVESGLVVCGRRHHNALLTLFMLIRFKKRNTVDIVQGFITSDDRFVDRKEAYLIADNARRKKP